VPVLPESQRDRARTLDTDPLRYLRGVLGFFLGSGALIALVLGLTGVAPKALLLAGVLWALLGVLTGIVDLVLEPLGELAGGALARLGFAPARPDRVTALLEHAGELAGPLQQPEAAVAELLALQRSEAAQRPGDDIRIGLALAELYERQLQDPGRALGELRRLIDRHPQLRQAARLRARLAELRARHFASSPP
jgi:hypothetical protein